MNPLILLGSARSDGETAAAIRLAFPDAAVDVVDLLSLNISHYDYDGKNSGDDFLPLIERILKVDDIVFATPVYWYAMSAVMKVFFDRFSDLITRNKPLGRDLAGKKVWVLTTGTDPALPEGFEIPFKNTATYFSMDYRGICYLYTHSGAKSDPSLKIESTEALKQWGKRILISR